MKSAWNQHEISMNSAWIQHHREVKWCTKHWKIQGENEISMKSAWIQHLWEAKNSTPLRNPVKTKLLNPWMNKRPFATNSFHIQFQMLTEQEVPKPCYCAQRSKKSIQFQRTAAPYFPQTVSDHMVQTSDKLFCLILLDAALSNSEVDSSDLAMYLVVRKKPLRQAEFVRTWSKPWEARAQTSKGLVFLRSRHQE